MDVSLDNRGINYIISQYKSSAKKRGIEFSLSFDDVKSLVMDDCHYCGNPPVNRIVQYTKNSIGKKYPENRKTYSFYTGIDRIDNTIGYIKNNCVPCCKRCNYAKTDLSSEQFKNWIKRLYINLFRKHSEKTIGYLIDSLITIDMKCWWAQEDMLNPNLTDEQKARAGERTQGLNDRRNRLVRAIDDLLDFSDDTPTEKTYHTYFREE